MRAASAGLLFWKAIASRNAASTRVVVVRVCLRELLIRNDYEIEKVPDVAAFGQDMYFVLAPHLDGPRRPRLPDEINLGRRRVLPPGPKRRILGLGAFQPPEDTAEERHSRAGMMRADANLSRAAMEQELL